MKPKSYEVVVMAVEDGVDIGWARAHKHDSQPDSITIKAEIIEGVLNMMNEWFDFEDHPRESW